MNQWKINALIFPSCNKRSANDVIKIKGSLNQLSGKALKINFPVHENLVTKCELCGF